MNTWRAGWISALLLLASSAPAQQSESFGPYTIHFNALNSDQLPPQVARAYGLERSSSRAILNITVMKADEDGGMSHAVAAKVAASARNLTGQTREIELHEVSEPGGAIYYIGEFRINNLETFDFDVHVKPEDNPKPLEIKFRMQFYTE